MFFKIIKYEIVFSVAVHLLAKETTIAKQLRLLGEQYMGFLVFLLQYNVKKTHFSLLGPKGCSTI